MKGKITFGKEPVPLITDFGHGVLWDEAKTGNGHFPFETNTITGSGVYPYDCQRGVLLDKPEMPTGPTPIPDEDIIPATNIGIRPWQAWRLPYKGDLI